LQEFYPDAHDAFHQSCSFWTADPGALVACEGLRREWDGRRPYATGDPVRFSWGAVDLGLYGSSHVGVFGGVAARTDSEGILALDCLATDAHHGPAFPTLLLYNPHADERRVTAAPALPPGTAQRRVYDAVAQRFLPATAAAPFTLTVPPDGAIPAVFIPADAAVHMRNGRLCAGETVIDWHEGLQSP